MDAFSLYSRLNTAFARWAQTSHHPMQKVGTSEIKCDIRPITDSSHPRTQKKICQKPGKTRHFRTSIPFSQNPSIRARFRQHLPRLPLKSAADIDIIFQVPIQIMRVNVGPHFKNRPKTYTLISESKCQNLHLNSKTVTHPRRLLNSTRWRSNNAGKCR